MDDRLAAVLALRRWLDHAVGDSRIEHRKAFWIALDVLEMAVPDSELEPVGVVARCLAQKYRPIKAKLSGAL